MTGDDAIALMAEVEALRLEVGLLEAQLAERDAEIARLRRITDERINAAKAAVAGTALEAIKAAIDAVKRPRGWR